MTSYNGCDVTIRKIENNNQWEEGALIENPHTAKMNKVILQIKEIDALIKANLGGITGNPYHAAMKQIDTYVGLLNVKKGDFDENLKKINICKINLLKWKEYAGSEICTVLDSNLEDEKNRHEIKYGMIPTDSIINIEHIKHCTHTLLQEYMKVDAINGIQTKGGFTLDLKKRIKQTPETLKTHWPDKKGEIPELLKFIDLINLEILKIELLSKKTALQCIETNGMSIRDILM